MLATRVKKGCPVIIKSKKTSTPNDPSADGLKLPIGITLDEAVYHHDKLFTDPKLDLDIQDEVCKSFSHH